MYELLEFMSFMREHEFQAQEELANFSDVRHEFQAHEELAWSLFVTVRETRVSSPRRAGLVPFCDST